MTNLNDIKIGTLHEDGSVSAPAVPEYVEITKTDYNTVYECKDTIEVNEDTGERHRLLIVVHDLYEATGDDQFEEKPYVCNIISIIDKDSLSEKERESIAESVRGWLPADQIGSVEIYEYGYQVSLEESEMRATDDFKDWIADMLPRISMMYGFYMDRPVNRIGTPGWDFIHGKLGF